MGPRFVFGAIVFFFTFLFGLVVEPNASSGYIVMTGGALSGILFLLVRWGRPRFLQFFKETAVPYLLVLSFGSALTIIAFSNMLHKMRNAEPWPAIIVSVPLLIIGIGIMYQATAKTRQLKRRSA